MLKVEHGSPAGVGVGLVAVLAFTSHVRPFRDPREYNKVSKCLFDLGERISPTDEPISMTWMVRRPISNIFAHAVFITEVPTTFYNSKVTQLFLWTPLSGLKKFAKEVATAEAEILMDVWKKFFPPVVNKEVEKQLQQIKSVLQEKKVLNQACQDVVYQFAQVVEQFYAVNEERAHIQKVISSEAQQLVVKEASDQSIVLTELQQFFLPYFQTLIKELGDLAGEQPKVLKVHVEFAVQIDEEKRWADKALSQIQTLGKELSVVTNEGIELKEKETERLKNLFFLVQAATSNRSVVLSSDKMRTGRYPAPVSRESFIFGQIQV